MSLGADRHRQSHICRQYHPPPPEPEVPAPSIDGGRMRRTSWELKTASRTPHSAMTRTARAGSSPGAFLNATLGGGTASNCTKRLLTEPARAG